MQHTGFYFMFNMSPHCQYYRIKQGETGIKVKDVLQAAHAAHATFLKGFLGTQFKEPSPPVEKYQLRLITDEEDAFKFPDDALAEAVNNLEFQSSATVWYEHKGHYLSSSLLAKYDSGNCTDSIYSLIEPLGLDGDHGLVKLYVIVADNVPKLYTRLGPPVFILSKVIVGRVNYIEQVQNSSITPSKAASSRVNFNSAQSNASIVFGSNLPTALYEPVFAYLYNSMHDLDAVEVEKKPYPGFDMLRFLHGFVTVLNDPKYKMEASFDEAVKGYLIELFGEDKFEIYKRSVDGDGKTVTETDYVAYCTTLQGLQVPYIIVEDKPMSGVGREADVQAAFSYQRMITLNDANYNSVRDITCCPCLLVGLEGNRIRFRTVYFTDKVYADHFGDITLESLEHNANMDRIQQMLQALRNAARDLRASYDKIHIGSRIPSAPHLFPRLAYPGDGPEKTLQFFNRYPTGALFDGRYGEDLAVVKFVPTQYGYEAHEHLANCGYAPKILWHGNILRGYDMIIMERINGGDLTDYPGSLRTDEDEILTKEQFEQGMRAVDEAGVALRKLWERGYVHGDIRESNIRVCTDSAGKVQVYLLDFDWAGPAGAVRYPYSINSKIDWPCAADKLAGKPITLEHDKKMYEKLSMRMRRLPLFLQAKRLPSDNGGDGDTGREAKRRKT